MSINLLLEHFSWQFLLEQIGFALLTVIFLELVRDSFHWVSHSWKPLMRLHNIHHKAFRTDFTKVNVDVYKKAALYYAIPETATMFLVSIILAAICRMPGVYFGCLHAAVYLTGAFVLSQGWPLNVDYGHQPGALVTLPHPWLVNRTYHWRHHFDNTNAYYSGFLTLFDKLIGASISLQGKTIGITGASGTMGRALLNQLVSQGANVIALTTNVDAAFDLPQVKVLPWQIGSEANLLEQFRSIDILILNHGINVGSRRSFEAIETSYHVNTFSVLKLTELFLQTVTGSTDVATKELWINTSEAEVSPAFIPLYELSKRTIGDLITLKRLDSPCVIRKLILGSFKSQMNPIGILSPEWVAKMVVASAKRDIRNIIVTFNPLAYVMLPLRELIQAGYFRICTKSSPSRHLV